MKNNNLKLFLIKGTSGAGKTTLAQFIKQLCDNSNIRCVIAEADSFFEQEGEYCFNPEKLGEAHKTCQETVENACFFEIPVVIVSNTNTSVREYTPYINIANKYGYQITSLIVEKLHTNFSIHSVPLETISKQEERLLNSIKLK